MKTIKTVFILPGYRQKPTNKAFKKLCIMLKKADFSPVLINVSWNNKAVPYNTDQFIQIFKKVRRRKKYILGFSFGAVMAFLASTQVETTGIILCSLSPFFNEDIQSIPTRSALVARKTRAKKIIMVFGTNEADDLVQRVKETYALLPIKQKYLLPVKNAGHDIGGKYYLKTLQLVANSVLQ